MKSSSSLLFYTQVTLSFGPFQPALKCPYFRAVSSTLLPSVILDFKELCFLWGCSLELSNIRATISPLSIQFQLFSRSVYCSLYPSTLEQCSLLSSFYFQLFFRRVCCSPHTLLNTEQFSILSSPHSVSIILPYCSLRSRTSTLDL